MDTYVVERRYVVPGRFYVKAKDLDEAILKADRGEHEEEGIEFFTDCAESDARDDLRVRHELSDVDDWVVAEERARERGYYVDEKTGADELADRIYRVAQTLEGSVLKRLACAHERLIYAPGLPNRVRWDADERAKRMIEDEQGGATEDLR